MSQYIYEYHNSKSFYTMSWIAFIVSFGGMLAGIVFLEGTVAMKGFLAMSYLFSISACFTLAKVVRDKYESDKFINKVEHAKTEKFLNESNGVVSV
ncbi:MAG: YiaA/YiaB family inner membrane protein [Bacteroidota bacterium]